MKKYNDGVVLNDQEGFTLIEVMVAMVILGIGILSVMSLQYVVTNGTTNSNAVTQEMMLAQTLMEQYKNVADPTSLSNASLVGVDQAGEVGAGPYNVDLAVTNPLGGNASRFISITVTKNGGIGGHELILQSVTHGSGI